MKRIVNGNEIELPDAPDAQIEPLADRLVVRTADGTATALAARAGEKTLVSYRGRVFEIERAGGAKKRTTAAATGDLRAPMPGVIVDVLVAAGDHVDQGQKVLVLEAMKTQQPVFAPFPGTVKELPVEKGQQVKEGETMIKIEKQGG